MFVQVALNELNHYSTKLKFELKFSASVSADLIVIMATSLT